MTIEPSTAESQDLTIRHVMNFEASIKQSDKDTQFDSLHKPLTVDADAADPILVLRRGKDKNIANVRCDSGHSFGGILPKAAAIRRAIKMATRTAYKSSNSGHWPALQPGNYIRGISGSK